MLKATAALIALGSAGILILIPITAWQIEALQARPLPPLLLAVVAALQPFLLLVVAASVGTVLAPRLGLRSLVAERAAGRRAVVSDLRGVPVLILVSMLLGLAINLADAVARPLWLPEGTPWLPYEEAWSPVTLAFGVLYGGLTEEVTFRWGLTSLVVWLCWLASGRPRVVPVWMFAAGIVISAFVFAAGHVPAVAAMVPLSAGPVVRTLLFNSLAGCWLGWIFWRKNLEAAMLSHAAIHVGFAVYALAAPYVGFCLATGSSCM